MADFPTEGAPPFINRRLSLAEWASYVAGYQFGRLAPSRLVLHHTFRPDEPQWTGINTLRGIQRFYAGKGWSSAPHIFTAPDGIWLATPMSQIGIHAGTGNGSISQGWYSIGLEMVGYFDNKRPSGATWQHSLAVMGELSRRLRIPPRQLISFHRDYTNAKSCPGWAVSKEWIWAQVEAYLNNVAPPPAPAPTPQPPGTITPSDERLLEALLEQSFGRKTNGQGYSADWAFHQFAVERGLGMPMAPSSIVGVEGKQINYQPFAKDTLFCEVPNWGDVKTLSELLGGSIPPAGLGRVLLNATFQAGGTSFRPDWAFHQFAVIQRVGPPVGKSEQFALDGVQYAYQAFAVDTVYNVVPNWSEVRLLSGLAGVSDAPRVRLREKLLAETYRQAGTVYHPEWAFHQLARGYNIGAPLSPSFQVKVEQTTYALQVYALDALYNVVPRWSEVKRLRDLATSHGMPILGGSDIFGDVPFGTAEAEVVVDGDYEPPAEVDYHVTAYSPQASAHSEREGFKVRLVVLHGLAGTAEETLARLTAIGARFATHYYVDQTGKIYQLVDERKAAWHAGFGTAAGTWYNLNRLSIGVALERPTGWPAQAGTSSNEQILALRWLLRALDRRYSLSPKNIVLWSSFAGSEDLTLDGLPLDVLREALG